MRCSPHALKRLVGIAAVVAAGINVLTGDAVAEETKQAASAPKDKQGMDAPPAREKLYAYDTVFLQGLNKVTARAESLEAPVGTVIRFGNLEIIPRTCWKSPPEEQPENAALLEIWELKPKQKPQQIFYGWMFSSSPGLSALEHPVYDVTVLECKKHSGAL